MRLSEFLKDTMVKTGSQIRESTREEYISSMNDFIGVMGDIDYQAVTIQHGEVYRQACLDKGNRPATVSKKLRQLKRIFQLAVHRRQLEGNPLQFIDMPRSPKKKVDRHATFALLALRPGLAFTGIADHLTDSFGTGAPADKFCLFHVVVLDSLTRACVYSRTVCALLLKEITRIGGTPILDRLSFCLFPVSEGGAPILHFALADHPANALVVVEEFLGVDC